MAIERKFINDFLIIYIDARLLLCHSIYMNNTYQDGANEFESNEMALRKQAIIEDAERFARDLDAISDALPMPVATPKPNDVRKHLVFISTKPNPREWDDAPNETYGW